MKYAINSMVITIGNWLMSIIYRKKTIREITADKLRAIKNTPMEGQLSF